MSLVWINGNLIDKADARVSPFDHGFLYGDGVWEHLRVSGGVLLLPREALAFLQNAATLLNITIPLSSAELADAIEATIRANQRVNGYIRVIVTHGPGTIGPDPRKLDPQVLITAEEYLPFPFELYGYGLHVSVAPHRVDLSNPVFRIRALGRPHIVMAKTHALRKGCLEALILDSNEKVSGGTEGGVYLVRGGTTIPVQTHPPDVACLATNELAREVGAVAPVTDATLDDLLTADEVFLAGTSCGVIAIVRVEDHVIGTGNEGPTTRSIRLRYQDMLQKKGT